MLVGELSPKFHNQLVIDPLVTVDKSEKTELPPKQTSVTSQFANGLGYTLMVSSKVSEQPKFEENVIRLTTKSPTEV